MNNIVGINNIQVSCVDGIIYIANTNVVEPGIPGSLAVYDTHDGHLISSTHQLTWNNDTSCLTTLNLSAHTIDTHLVTANELDSKMLKISNLITTAGIKASSFVNTLTLTTNQVAFRKKSESKPSAGFFFNDETDQLNFMFNTKENIVLTFDSSNRIAVNGKLNIKSCVEDINPKGLQSDQKGDILINNNYIYYCIADYNGTDNIWVRWAVTETDWEN